VGAPIVDSGESGAQEFRFLILILQIGAQIYWWPQTFLKKFYFFLKKDKIL
jgi:hypothetical protein